MKNLLNKNRFIQIEKGKTRKYFLYAIGEIIIIIVGIFLAIQFNQYVENRSNKKVQCEYLNDLYYVLERDTEDLENNILEFKDVNKKIVLLLKGISDKTISQSDSLVRKSFEDKTIMPSDSSALFVNIPLQHIEFGQRSKSKIEEIKYSNITLIENKELRNRIILYQDQVINLLRIIEKASDQSESYLNQYYIDNNLLLNTYGYYFRNKYGYKFQNKKEFDLNKVLTDQRYITLVMENFFYNMDLSDYSEETMIKELDTIKNLINEELEHCK